MRKGIVSVLTLAAVVLFNQARADEGMWLFNKPPVKVLKEKYRFEPTREWLEHIMKSSVRVNSGGSASFVSPNGLVMTNHHVGSDAIQARSTKEKDYLKEGFHARTLEQELKCPEMELNVLQSIEDVTDKVNAAVKPDMKPDEAFAARRAAIAAIEKKSFEETKLRSDVVTLYNGGQYHLYRYKKYTDVRLVFAPEQQIAFFGGDPDNFEYPRFDLDVCFFRVYEDGKPAKTEHYLKWSKEGAKEDELVFVSGHPGRTNRGNTVAELEYLRDLGYPFLLQRLARLEVMLNTYSERSLENRRQAKDLLFSVANSRKARIGGLAGLLDPDLMKAKQAQEKKLRDFIARDEKLQDANKAFQAIAAAQNVRRQHIRRYTMLEAGAGFFCTQFFIARTLVRAAEELKKPNAERMPQFRDSALESTRQQLFADEPIYDDLEIVKLTNALTYLCEVIGYKDPLVQRVLAGKSPANRAAELIRGTKVKDVAERKKLFEGGEKAINASKDPMILLARLVDKPSRDVRKIFETQVDEVSRQAHAQIEKARFAMEGDANYPDATFTLRLAFGTVKGYEENGKKIPAWTTFEGLYARSAEHEGRHPFDLPGRWVSRKDKLDLKVPFNFVLTADIIGGNSGSPVFNRNGEVVGLIFDGNIQSLVADFAYTDKQGRAVAVHSQGILEALTKIYDARELVSELTGEKRSQK